MGNFNVKITLDNGENKELFYQFIPISHSILGEDSYKVTIYDFKVFMPELIDRYAVTIKGSLERYVKNDIKFKYNLKRGKRIRINRWW
jgi:hypothetical protein